MPGLFGFVGLGTAPRLDRATSEPVLREMGGRLAHGGSERIETWIDPEAAVAIGRCASPHTEPIPWPDTTARSLSFFDGVLHASADRAEDAKEPEERLLQLSGFFSSAAVARDPRRIVLAVDRHASHPITFAVLGDCLYFAAEAKALLAVPAFPRRLNPAVLGLFFGGGYALSDQTLLAGVERLTGGEMLVIDRDGWSRRAYWQYRLRDSGDGTSADQLTLELAELIRAAVARNFERPEHAYVLLSGGADSRAIAASAHELLEPTGARLRTVSWTFGDPVPESDEPVARRLAAALGSAHTWLARDVSHFGRDFLRLSYLLEGLSDTPASHPYEMEMIRRMSDRGASCVLRGDECFGWGNPVATVEDALSELGLRRLGGLARMEALLAPQAFAAWDEAGGAALDRLARSRHGQDPDEARDELYFSHRLQGLLNSISHAKFVVADHRNPLLDEAILDFNGRVPGRLRRDKQLFRRACARTFPRFWALPFAKHQNLVPWKHQFSSETPARRFLEAELADDDSTVWDYFRREAVRSWFAEMRPPEHAGAGVGVRTRAVGVARALLRRVPAVERRVRSEYQRRVLRPEDFFLRFLTVKAFLDLFLAGDGGRRAYEARIERALALDAASGRGRG